MLPFFQNNPIILWTCTSSANQVWKFKNGTISLAFDPQNKSDTYCLDTQPVSGTNHQSVVLNTCQVGSATQQWSVTSTGNIKNGATGNCLDITGSSNKDGTKLLVYPCGNGGTQSNQVWTLPRGANGTW
jgi:hypothetical protein